MHQPPQGYFHVGGDERSWSRVPAARAGCGEFEKPKFASTGCGCARTAATSASAAAPHRGLLWRAIRSDASRGQGIVKRRQRRWRHRRRAALRSAWGCGACSTGLPERRNSLRLPWARSTRASAGAPARRLRARRRQGAALLLHSEGAGARIIGELVAAPRAPMPASTACRRGCCRWRCGAHTASTGIELWLAGHRRRRQPGVGAAQRGAPEYREALAEQMAVAQAILAGWATAANTSGASRCATRATCRWPTPLGCARRGVRRRGAAGRRWPRRPRSAPRWRSRSTICSPRRRRRPRASSCPAGAPLGTLAVDGAKCTFVPELRRRLPGARWLDNPEKPQLRFIEKNCVQCGLCAITCPEDAIVCSRGCGWPTGGKARKTARVLAEAEPYRCIRCGKPSAPCAPSRR